MLRLHRLVLCLISFPLLVSSCVSNSGIESAPTCLLVEPPNEAGELAAHRQLIKVYPRKSHITASFNGCQTVWLEEQGAWSVSRLYIRDGKVTALQMPGNECKYDEGKPASANGGDCPKGIPEPFPSAPAGCISKFRSDVQPTALCVNDYEAR